MAIRVLRLTLSIKRAHRRSTAEQFHRQISEAVQPSVGDQLRRANFDPGDRSDHCFQHDFHLQARKVHACAHMWSRSPAELVDGIAGEVEAIGIAILPFIAIGRPVKDLTRDPAGVVKPPTS